MWMLATGAVATLAAWGLRETVMSRAIAGLSSVAAGYVAGLILVGRFMHLSDTIPVGFMIGMLGTGPLGALLALALSIKLTEAKDGSRAMVTAAASAALILMLR